jgi:CRISPR/Cas system-associated endoribonuclease Cas2
MLFGRDRARVPLVRPRRGVFRHQFATTMRRAWLSLVEGRRGEIRAADLPSTPSSYQCARRQSSVEHEGDTTPSRIVVIKYAHARCIRNSRRCFTAAAFTVTRQRVTVFIAADIAETI